jgi:hypothetical protein
VRAEGQDAAEVGAHGREAARLERAVSSALA